MAVMRLSCLFVNGGGSSTIRWMIAHDSLYNPGEAAAGVSRSRGGGSALYRLWRAGKPLDTPVRGYQRYEEGPDGKVVPVQAPAPSPKRKRKTPFEAAL